MDSEITVTFLGTGTSQGIPVIGSNHPVCLSTDPRDKRLRVSIWMRWSNYSCIVDCGPDFRQQMLRAGVPRVDSILLTHEHSDHTAGIDDIRPYNFMQRQPMPFYAHPRVFESLHKRFEYIFATENKYPGAPQVKEIEIDKDSSFALGGKKITVIEAFHDQLPVLGFRVDDFTYLTDIKTIEQSEIDKLKGTKVLVVNALQEEPHYSHFTLAEALEFIQKIKPETAYLTHISHKMGFHEEVEKKLPPNVHLAYDNLTITI